MSSHEATNQTALVARGVIPGVGRIWTVSRSWPVVPIATILIVIVCGIFGPWIVPHDPNQPDPLLRLQPPAWQAGGDWSHPLGTDPVGRDVLSRLIVGSRVSLIIAITVVLIAGSIGTILALFSGYFQGWVDSAIMRVTDAVISMPFLVIAVAVAGVAGNDLRSIILVLGLLSWSNYARILRSEVLSLKQSDFVILARITGVPTYRILLRHILPSLMNTLIVLATLQLGITIIAASSLDFLGLGVPQPTATWGGMLADGRTYISSAWWVVTMPGIVLSVTVMATNFLGDWLRLRLDPKQRGL